MECVEDFVGIFGEKYGREVLKEEVVVAGGKWGEGEYIDPRWGLAAEAILLLGCEY